MNRRERRKVQRRKDLFKRVFRFSTVMPVLMIVALAGAAIPLLAFEAQVVNVTATIDNLPLCGANSLGYWANNEGCDRGSGTSDWASEVNELSFNNFSGVFSDITGEEICEALWIPNCGRVHSAESTLCKAHAKLLANELNVASGNFYMGALIARADDGRDPFDDLGLTPTSTVYEALSVIEGILADPDATRMEVRDAEYVSGRIYEFYGKEHDKAPMCILDPEDPDNKCPRKRPHHYDSRGRAVYETENGFEVYGDENDPRHYEDCRDKRDHDEEDCRNWGNCDYCKADYCEYDGRYGSCEDESEDELNIVIEEVEDTSGTDESTEEEETEVLDDHGDGVEVEDGGEGETDVEEEDVVEEEGDEVEVYEEDVETENSENESEEEEGVEEATVEEEVEEVVEEEEVEVTELIT